MVKDIRSGASSSSPYELAVVDDMLYFRADDGIHGSELWKSDGTSAGTVMVNDIRPDGGSYPGNLTVLGDTLYFTANDGDHGYELWKVDAENAVMVADINPGEASSYAGFLTVVEDQLYFCANDGVHGYEFWRLDAEGVEMVADVNPRSTSSFTDELTVLGDTIYFRSDITSAGAELWKVNSEGVSMVADINPGSAPSTPTKLTVLDDTLYFTADDGVNGRELWKTNNEGTTSMVADIRPDGSSSPVGLTVMGDALYFQAHDSEHGEELWMADASGASLVADISSGTNSSSPRDLTAVGDTLYFRASERELYGEELWKLHAGEVSLVEDITPGIDGTNIQEMTAFGNTLYFSIYREDDTRELWMGDSDGVRVVLDASPGGNWSSYEMTVVGDTLYFQADDETHGRETWTITGMPETATMLKDINLITASANVREMVELDDSGYFIADDGMNGVALWTSDGTTGGTHLVKEIIPSTGATFSSSMVNLNGTLFFCVGNSSNTMHQLWTSDGTEQGTVLLKDDFWAANLTVFNGRAFFTAWDAEHGSELWSSDGTEAGTEIFMDISSGTSSSSPNSLSVVGGTLFFKSNGGQVWMTDGNSANLDGTHRFADLIPDNDLWGTSVPYEVGGEIFFHAFDTTTGHRVVWHASDISCVDATPLTSLANPITTGEQTISDIDGLAAIFQNPGEFPRDLELWTSSGTDQTTQKAAVIHSGGPHEVQLGQQVVLGDKLYFTLKTFSYYQDYYDILEEDPEYFEDETPEDIDDLWGEYNTTELWVSDGTAGNTHLVQQFSQPTTSIEDLIRSLCVWQDQVFFLGYDAVSGRELWTTDGVTTSPVADVNPGAGSSWTSIVGDIAGSVFVSADDGIHGKELWRLLDDTDPNVSPVVTLPADTGSVVNVQRDGDDLVVAKGGTELLRSAMGSIAGVTIQGAPESEVVIVNIDGLNVSNLPNGLTILAGEGTNDNDTLILSGSTTVSNYDYTTGGPESGTITLDGLTVNFQEFEPIIDQLNVTNRTFSIGTEESQKIVIGDDAGSDGYSMIDDGGAGTFESLSFTSPTNSLAIVGGEGADEIIVTTMDARFATPITIEGGSGNDVIDASESDMPMVLSGGEGDDELLGGTVDDVLDGGAGNDVLDGGPGSDDVDGGTGNNEVISDVADGVVVLNEEGTFHLNATFVGCATADIDWGDDTSNTYDVANDTVTGSHVYPTKGDYTVVIAAPDSVDPVQTLTVYVTVNNVTPDVNAGDDQTIDEGGSVSLAGSFNDPGSFDAHTYLWDFGDGSATVPGTLTTDHVYVDSGSYTVTLSVADDESVGTDSFTVTVNNVAPSLTLLADTVVVSQDTGGTNSGTYFDPGDDTVSLSASAGDLIDNSDGTWSWSFGATNDPNLSQQVVITAEDDDGASREVSFQLFVNTVQPGLADVSAGSTIAEDGLVTLSGQITDPGSYSTFELQCDWGDGNVETFTYAAGTSGFSETHQYESGGAFDIHVTLTDMYGGESTADAVTMATGTRVHEGVLQVVGTEDSDHVLIGKLCSQMLVIADFLPGWLHLERFNAADIDSVEVFLGDGNDTAVVASSVSVPAKLDGGAGNDHLKGGRGDDILLGGAGDDLLLGNQGRDLMIGGTGSDRLVGNSDDDILIGGTTAYDADGLALDAIMAEWTSDRDYVTRVNNLRGVVGTGTKLNGTYYLIAADPQQPNVAATVFDDDERDVMTGGNGFDWFFANYQHDDEGRRDRITDLKAAEFAEDLDWIETIEEVFDPEA